MTNVRILEADLKNKDHAEAVVFLTDQYCMDSFGNGSPLDEEVKSRLIAGLDAHPAKCILLAYWEDRPVGMAVCFLGFSTFKAKPLLNIHDLSVLADYRGRGIGGKLIAGVAKKAREMGCCKLTLEVQEHNGTALNLYRKSGFGDVRFSYGQRKILFLEKPL